MTVKQTVDVQIDVNEMGRALIGYVIEKYLQTDFDDAGCDWMTKDGNVYVSGLDWLVIYDANAASIVDTANILIYGEKLIAK